MLGPVLFIIYVNDLPEITKSIAQMFADDTKLFSIVPDENKRAELQEDIDKLTDWAEEWQLQFNIEKCKVLHIGRNNKKYAYTMNTNQDTIPLDTTMLEKDLGVFVDPELKFTRHIENQVDKANRILGMIRRTFEHINIEIMNKLFTSLVRPHLEFCNVVWSPIYQKDINLIEGVLRRATRMVPELQGLEYEERLRKAKLPSMQYRRARGDMIEVYKLLRGHYTTNSGLLELHGNTLTRGHQYKLKKNYTRTSLRKHFFKNRVVDLWNSLPSNTVEAPSINSFKNRLDRTWTQYRYTRTTPQAKQPNRTQDTHSSQEYTEPHTRQEENQDNLQDRLTGL